MTLVRRRFLALSACALTMPGLARAAAAGQIEWQGRGLGAAVSLRLVGAAPAQARRTIARVTAELARIEAIASLHVDSALVRLNRDGRLSHPPQGLRAILDLAGQVHRATGGAFDPTVQPLWRALAEGGDVAAARARIGWNRLQIGPEAVVLDHGQALTLNGIAQGWAADRIAALLRDEGFGQALIDMGEVQALGHRPDGRPWRAAIAGPDGAILGETALADRALATSSPMGSRIGAGVPHILGPQGQGARWSTVAVSAGSAALADALSTAFVLMDRAAIAAALSHFPGARVETLA